MPSQPRNTKTERRCRECKGGCPKCIGGWVRWAHFDPLELLKPLRTTFLSCRGFEPTYRNMRRRATGGYPLACHRMVEAAIRCDVAAREATVLFRRLRAYETGSAQLRLAA